MSSPQMATIFSAILPIFNATQDMKFPACNAKTPCEPDFFCYGGTYTCLPCSVLCKGYNKELCLTYCDGSFETTSPPQQALKTGATDKTTTSSTTTAPFISETTSSPTGSTTIIATLNPSTWLEQKDTNQPDPALYMIIIFVLISLIVIIVVILAFAKIYSLIKRNETTDKGVEAGHLLPRNRKKSRLSSTSAPTCDKEYPPSIRPNLKPDVGTPAFSNICNEDLANGSADKKSRDVNRCTSCDSNGSADSQSSTALLTHPGNKGAIHIHTNITIDGQKIKDISDRQDHL